MSTRQTHTAFLASELAKMPAPVLSTQGIRYGVEFEFKLSADSAARFRSTARWLTTTSSTGNRKQYLAEGRWYASFDHQNLIEFRSYPLYAPLDIERDVMELRRECGLWLRGHGLEFLYYGMHLSVWNFCPERPVVLCNPLVEIEAHRPLLVVVIRHDPHNMYWDPYVNAGHSILPAVDDGRPQHGRTLTTSVDLLSLEVICAWLRLHCTWLTEATNRWPVPGMAVRCKDYRKAEVLLGWMDEADERRLLEDFAECWRLAGSDGRWREMPDSTYRLSTTKARFAVLLLRDHSFELPPKLPDANRFWLDSRWSPYDPQPSTADDSWTIVGALRPSAPRP